MIETRVLNHILTSLQYIFAWFSTFVEQRQMIETASHLNLTQSDSSNNRVGIGTKVLKDSFHSYRSIFVGGLTLYILNRFIYDLLLAVERPS